jgi:NAD(P)H-dependent FMN reductase
MLKIKIILGSVREGRFGDKPAQWIFEKAKAHGGLDVELLDLKDYPLPLFAEPQVPAMVGGSYPNETAQKWAAKIGEADGFIFVTPEYNHGYSSVLKNAIDFIFGEWNRKPAAFVGYGVNGGVRAIEQLKVVVNSNLRMHPVAMGVNMNNPWHFVNDKGEFDASSFEKAGDVMLDELAWLGDALKSAREKDSAAGK